MSHPKDGLHASEDYLGLSIKMCIVEGNLGLDPCPPYALGTNYTLGRSS